MKRVHLGPKVNNYVLIVDFNRPFDIHEFHAKMIEKLKSDIKNADDLLKLAKIEPEKKYIHLREYDNRKNGKILSYYMDEVVSYLSTYDKFSSSIKTSDIMTLYCSNKKYVEMCSRFTKIQITYKAVTADKICYNCGENIDNSTKDLGFVICKCSAQEKYVQPHTNRGEVGETYIKSNNVNPVNIMKEFDCYSCNISPTDLPSDWIELLDDYFTERGMPIGETYKNQKKDGRYTGNSNRVMLTEALKVTGMKKSYKHVNYVGHYYFGWDIPDTKDYRNDFLEIYMKTENVFYQLENKDRSSSIPTQYRTFKILELLGFKCSRCEFKLPANEEDLLKIESLWKRMCEGAGVKYIRTKRE